MKKNLQKKLSAFLLAGMAFIVKAMMFSASANAQIVYTDLNPDITVSCSAVPCINSYNLDLNNDGTIDFTLYASKYVDACSSQNTTKEVYITPQSGNAAGTLKMNTYDTIGSNIAFSASNGILKSVTSPSNLSWNSCISSSGYWPNGADGYLGLQFTIGNNTYYGWVGLTVAVLNQGPTGVFFIVKDYAYNSIPNQAILAGQTVATGISPLSFGEGLGVRFFPNPATNHLTIDLGSNNKKVEIIITDITGKIIYSTTASDPDSYREQKIEVNTQDFAAGIYVVQIQAGDFIEMKKLVIEK